MISMLSKRKIAADIEKGVKAAFTNDRNSEATALFYIK